MNIETIFLYIGAFFLGSIFGSFACCQAWRIHEKQAGKKLGKRSVCMHCKKQLSWLENIPILSWLFLRGKCSKCHKKIGYAEILSEIGLGLVFLAIAYRFGLSLETLILFPAFVIYWVIIVYDAKWGELPVPLMLVEIPLAVAFQFIVKGDFVYAAIGTGLLSGLYYLLYFFSKEKAVGGGDWILCISIAIFLGHWQLAIMELFLSNFAATLAAVPQIFKKKKGPIPFGPFLVLSMLVILFFSDYLLKFLIFY